MRGVTVAHGPDTFGQHFAFALTGASGMVRPLSDSISDSLSRARWTGPGLRIGLQARPLPAIA